MSDKVYIVILNYNGWRDTIECLESVFKSHYSNFQIIVCDNCSSDQSLEKIKKWAEGAICLESSSEFIVKEEIARSVFPLIEKPIFYMEYMEDDLEIFHGKTEPQLILIRSKENKGFSGGNNIALKYIFKRNDFAYIWFLNNDTVVNKEALLNLVQEFKMNQEFPVGIIGSVVCEYNDPGLVQSVGGRLNTFTFKAKGVCEKWKYGNLVVDKAIDYHQGASFLVARPFIEKIRLFDESYFLYFEEAELAEQASRYGFKIRYAMSSIIYHKGSISIGKMMGELQEYHFARSRMIFAKRYYSLRVIFLFYKFFEQICNYSIAGKFNRVKAVLKGIRDGYLYRSK